MSKDRDNTRQKAAEARAAAMSKEKRRERTVRIIGASAIAVVVVAIVGAAIIIPKLSNEPAPGPNPAAALPAGVLDSTNEYAYGKLVNPEATNKPVLAIWEDFQCPACAFVEENNGVGIQKLAAEGKVRLIWRPTTFLDPKFKTDASERATAAWGCAIDANKNIEYHDWVFANQPAKEGDGWTNEQLLQYGKDVGITGDTYTAFESCVTSQKYAGWSVNSTDAFRASDANGTPYATLDGKPIDNETLKDEAKLIAFIDAQSGSATPSASVSAS
jgi:protein-disulfide isomerase